MVLQKKKKIEGSYEEKGEKSKADKITQQDIQNTYLGFYASSKNVITYALFTSAALKVITPPLVPNISVT